MAILVCFITLTGFWTPTVPAAEVQRVRFGSTVTLSCNMSYLYDTTWLKQSPDLVPTVILCASLKDGQPFEAGCQVSQRYSVSLVNRSLALTISDIKEEDLGLYFCVANLNTHAEVGKGTRLCATLPDSSWFQFQHCYTLVVVLVLSIMLLAVCVTHWKTRRIKNPNKSFSTL